MNVEERIQILRKKLSEFFNQRFQGFNTNPHLNEKGYHMDYLGVEYDMEIYSKPHLQFELKAKLPQPRNDLEEKLSQERVSNSRLNLTKYLSNQEITVNGAEINVTCRLKREPKDPAEAKRICEQLWGNVIKNIMMRASYSK